MFPSGVFHPKCLGHVAEVLLEAEKVVMLISKVLLEHLGCLLLKRCFCFALLALVLLVLLASWHRANLFQFKPCLANPSIQEVALDVNGVIDGQLLAITT